MSGKLKKLLIYWIEMYKYVKSNITRMFDFKALLEQAEIGRSRSSVINPLQWAVVIILTGLLAILLGHAPSWLLVFFSCLLGLLVLLLVLAYIYFGVKNPDALRSEKYVLVKAAIEKQYAGDSLTGLQEVISQFDSPGQPKLLPDAKRIDLGPQ
jgi:hypothetical protein